MYWTQASHKRSAPWISRARPDEPGSVQPLVKGSSKGGRLALGGGLLAWVGDGDGGAHALAIADLDSPRV